MGNKVAIDDRAIARIASRQHGVITTRQLQSVGLGRTGISRRTQAGRLYRLHKGVYAVGYWPPSIESRWMAAVLVCGQKDMPDTTRRDDVEDGRGEADTKTVLAFWGAALSHRSAAVCWELLPPADEPVDVTVPGNGGRARRRGIRLHRSSTLLPAAVTLRAGIPVTTPERTIADLRRAAAVRGDQRIVFPRELRRAIRQADVLGLPIGSLSELDRTRSDLERDFLRLCRRNRLPTPEVNVRVGRHLVDFLWRDRRLIVETDSYLYHRGRVAFQDDHGRDLDLRGLGYEVIRLSEKQLSEERDRAAAILAAELSRSAAPRPDL
jgi:very-short-patch-repair endonuclease